MWGWCRSRSCWPASLVALFARDAARRERRIDLAVFVALVWCALGRIHGPSLAVLLHALPIFRSLRVPSRFLGPAMVGFGLLAAGALAAGRRTLENGEARVCVRAALALELALVVGVALDICLTNQRVMQQGLDPRMSQRRGQRRLLSNTGADSAAFHLSGRRLRDARLLRGARVEAGARHPRRARGAGAARTAHGGRHGEKRWSPNRLEFDVQLDAPAM